MSKPQFKFLYGPVYSWRLGMSLGIDPVTADKKICNMDCIYCQLGRTTQFYTKREEFVTVKEIVEEIKTFPKQEIDHYTFCGRGEPTLAKNLGEMIEAVRNATAGKIAVITNAALIDQKDVQEDLARADFVLAKLDAASQDSLARVDIPAQGIDLNNIVEGLKEFKKSFSGKLALQMMFIQDNKDDAPHMVEIARTINADEIEINTPLRPSGVKPLSEDDIKEVKKYFEGLPVVTVFEAKKKSYHPLNDAATIRRHGNFKKTTIQERSM